MLVESVATIPGFIVFASVIVIGYSLGFLVSVTWHWLFNRKR